jgi:hypothetical protein
MGETRATSRDEATMWMDASSFRSRYVAQKNINNEKYPPLFEFDVIWHIGLGFAV